MVIVFTITKINYLVNGEPILSFVLPLSSLYLWYLILWLHYLSNANVAFPELGVGNYFGLQAASWPRKLLRAALFNECVGILF